MNGLYTKRLEGTNENVTKKLDERGGKNSFIGRDDCNVNRVDDAVDLRCSNSTTN